MVDFQAAFRRGLEAYKEREHGRLEVQELLREFKRQVYFATERQVVLIELPVEAGDATRLIASQPGNKGPDPQLEVCRLEIPSTGYPVSVKAADWELECADKPALEQALTRVLEEPENAGRIHEAAGRRDAGAGAPGVSVSVSAGTPSRN